MSTSDMSRRLAIIGGRLELDNDDIFGQLRTITGGRIAVFATASNYPDEVGAETVEELIELGFDAVEIPLYFANRKTTAFDPALIAVLNDYGHCYFTGGDQANIVNSLIQEGEETPMLTAIRALGKRGGLVAGSSAGAAMMSEHSIYGGVSLEGIISGVADAYEDPGILMDKGLSFFPYGIVDQHFIKRGRIGRLLVALHHTGERLGFGIDENTALFVEGNIASVHGELGVLLVEAFKPAFDPERNAHSGYRVSFLGIGDQYNLETGEITPAEGKAPLIHSEAAHQEPGNINRSVFGSYAFFEMFVRLAEGDPSVYDQEQGSAYDHESEQSITLTLARNQDTSGVWRKSVNKHYHYTLTHFDIEVQLADQTVQERQKWLARFTRDLVGDRNLLSPDARLVMTGGPLDEDQGRPVTEWICHFAQGKKVGIISAAAHDPELRASRYTRLFRDLGLEVIDLDITLDNSLYQSRNRDTLNQIASCEVLIFTGGSQQRLVDALLYHSEGSSLLKSVIQAYANGASLIGISGASSVFSRRMISGGTSYDALFFGRSIDVSQKGIDIEQGFNFFTHGMVDQNLYERYRLGRLIYACASEGEGLGFGILENSAMIAQGNGEALQAIGDEGFVVTDLKQASTGISEKYFSIENIKLTLIRPGQCYFPETGAVTGELPASAWRIEIDRLLDDLAFHVQREHRPVPEDDQVLGGLKLEAVEVEKNTYQLTLRMERDRASRNARLLNLDL